MRKSDGRYSSKPSPPLARVLSTIELTSSGPATPAADQAVSSRPWMAPT